MPTRNVSLTEHYDRFVEEQVSGGRFRNASEVMWAGLHLLELKAREEQEKITLLRTFASEAFDQLDQGQGIELNGPRQLSSFISKIGRRVATSAKRRSGRSSN